MRTVLPNSWPWQMVHFWPQLHSGRASGLSGSIPSLLLWFPSAPLWGKTSPLLTRRFPFLVFEHGCDNNCIFVLFPVIFICFEQKVLAKCSIIINSGSEPPISLILSSVFTNAFYLALVYSR